MHLSKRIPLNLKIGQSHTTSYIVLIIVLNILKAIRRKLFKYKFSFKKSVTSFPLPTLNNSKAVEKLNHTRVAIRDQGQFIVLHYLKDKWN